MTIEEFENTKFVWNMKCIYKGKEYPIVSVDFEEKLISIFETDINNPDWKRCENIEIIL